MNLLRPYKNKRKKNPNRWLLNSPVYCTLEYKPILKVWEVEVRCLEYRGNTLGNFLKYRRIYRAVDGVNAFGILTAIKRHERHFRDDDTLLSKLRKDKQLQDCLIPFKGK